MRIVAVDVGGTHARFAWAELADGRVTLGPDTVFKTSAFKGPGEAWRAFVRDGDAPAGAAFAIAAPIGSDEIKLTNNDWVFRPRELAAELGVPRVHLVNDFAAVAHAVPIAVDGLRHLCGPVQQPLPGEGVVSVVGPGTGLGVAMLVRGQAGDWVVATEGGHIGFAPSDAVEDRILERLRSRYGRASAERVVCGRGLADIHAVLSGEEADERDLWGRALAGDPAMDATLDRYCGLLGAVSGDLALAQGARAVVIAGGLGLRLIDRLPASSFSARFSAKGRFTRHIHSIPVMMMTNPQPGLLGAAAAFAAELV